MSDDAALRRDIEELEALKSSLIQTEIELASDACPPEIGSSFDDELKKEMIELRLAFNSLLTSCSDARSYMLGPDFREKAISHHSGRKHYQATETSIADAVRTAVEEAFTDDRDNDGSTQATDALSTEFSRLRTALSSALQRSAAGRIDLAGRRAMLDQSAPMTDTDSLEEVLGTVQALGEELAEAWVEQVRCRAMVAEMAARADHQDAVLAVAEAEMGAQKARLEAFVGYSAGEDGLVQAVRGTVKAAGTDLGHIGDATQYRAEQAMQGGAAPVRHPDPTRPTLVRMTPLDVDYSGLINICTQLVSSKWSAETRARLAGIDQANEALGREGQRLVQQWGARRRHLAGADRVLPRGLAMSHLFETFVADPVGVAAEAGVK